MKRFLCLCFAALLPAAAARADNAFCRDLTLADLEGRFVTVYTAEGKPDNFVHGNFVSAASGMLVLRLGDVFSYVHCEHVLSVVINTKVYGTPDPQAAETKPAAEAPQQPAEE